MKTFHRFLYGIIMTSLVPVITAHADQNGKDDPNSPLYFSSPEHAVEVVNKLLRAEDWPTLTRYYKLEDGHDRKTFVSGEFFLHSKRPEGAHPGLPWKYKHPFAPGFVFSRAEQTLLKEVVRVEVKLEIDQGGGIVQRGFAEFDMYVTEKGFQILPEKFEVVRKSDAKRVDFYLLRTGDDSIFSLRPKLALSLDALPAHTLENLPTLLARLAELHKKIADARLEPAEKRMTFKSGERHFDATDDELLASEAGQRIVFILESSEPAKVEAVLNAANYTGPMHLQYEKIGVRHVDAIGTGRLYFADEPKTVKFSLPRKGTGF